MAVPPMPSSITLWSGVVSLEFWPLKFTDIVTTCGDPVRNFDGGRNQICSTSPRTIWMTSSAPVVFGFHRFHAGRCYNEFISVTNRFGEEVPSPLLAGAAASGYAQRKEKPVNSDLLGFLHRLGVTGGFQRDLHPTHARSVREPIDIATEVNSTYLFCRNGDSHFTFV